MSSFKVFVKKMLSIAGLNNRTIELCTDEECMQQFRTAFIHKSIDTDAVSNYEFAEIQGDVIVNAAIVNYITKVRFPRVVNVDWITKLKTRFISKRGLSRLAEKEGFGEFIQYSEEYGEAFKDRNGNAKTYEELWKTEKYISLYEDTFESFIGTMVNIIDEKTSIKSEWGTPIPGPGYAAASTLIYKIFDTITIELNYYKVWDPVTRLKEIYDKRSKDGWIFSRLFKCITPNLNNRKINEGSGSTEREQIVFHYIAYAYLKGDRTAKTENIVKIASFESVNKDEAKNTTAYRALDVLKKYGIYDTPKDPYRRRN